METEDQSTKIQYPITGISSRDSVRKMLFELFQGDPELGPQEKLPIAQVVEALENAILEECKDPKSKQYRDKCRAVQIKLKGPRFEQCRRDLRILAVDAKTLIRDDYVQGKTTDNTSAGGSSGQVSEQISSQRPPVGAPGVGMMPRPTMGGQAPMGFRPTGPGGMRPRMMQGGQPPGFRPPIGGMMRPNIPTFNQPVQQQQQTIQPQQQVSIQPQQQLSERKQSELVQNEQEQTITTPQNQNTLKTQSNQNQELQLAQQQQSEEKHQFGAVQTKDPFSIQNKVQKTSSQSLNQSMISQDNQQNTPKQSNLPQENVQNNQNAKKIENQNILSVQSNQLSSNYMSILEENSDDNLKSNNQQQQQQNESVKILDQSVEIAERKESTQIAKKKKGKKKKKVGAVNIDSSLVEHKSPEQEQVVQNQADLNKSQVVQQQTNQVEENRPFQQIDNQELRFNTQQSNDQLDQSLNFADKSQISEQKQQDEDTSKLGDNYQFLDQSSSVIIENQNESILNKTQNNIIESHQNQHQPENILDQTSAILLNESLNLQSLNQNKESENLVDQKLEVQVQQRQQQSKPVSKNASQKHLLDLGQIQQEKQVSLEKKSQIEQSPRNLKSVEQQSDQGLNEQLQQQEQLTSLKSVDKQNRPMSKRSISQSSNQQQNNESDNVKRLQDALSYKRQQKKDLNEKIVHLENDCHLQQRKANLLMEENKQLRDDLKDKDRKLKQMKVIETELQAVTNARVRALENQLNERQQEINQLKKEAMRQKEEKNQYREKVQQLSEENNTQRQFLDNLLKSLEQRMANQQTHLHSQQVSVVHHSHSQESGANQSEQVEQLQRELRDQKHNYEQKIRELNDELNNRIRMLQRTERQNLQLQEKNQQLNELLSQVELQQLSTVAGSGSNQRDSTSMLNNRRQQQHTDISDSNIHRAYEEEGTGGDGGYNQSSIRNQNDYLISDEGGNIAAVNGGTMDQFEDESNHNNDDIVVNQPRNQRQQMNYQLEAVGGGVGGHTQFEEEGDQEDDIDEDDDYEDDDHMNGGEEDEEDEEGNQFDDNTQGIAQQFTQSNNRDNQMLGSQHHQQMNPLSNYDENEGYAGGQQTYGQSRQRKQGQRRRGNRQQNQQNTNNAAANNNYQNPRQRNSRGRQRSNQQHIQQQQQIIAQQQQQQIPITDQMNAPPSSQVAQSQLRQNQLSQAPPSEYFQNYGDSSSLFMHNQNRDQSAPFHQSQHHSAVNQREGGVAGQGVVLTAGRSNLQTSAESMMSAESGSTATAFLDKNQFHRGHNAPVIRQQQNQTSSLQSIQQNAQQQQQQQIQTGSNNQANLLGQSIQQVPSDLFNDNDNYTAAVGAPTSRAAAHPRQQRQQMSNQQQQQQNIYGGYQFQEEVKQSSGEIPVYYQMSTGNNQQNNALQSNYGSIRLNNSHQHNQFVGGSGEQEEDSSSGYFGGNSSSILQPQIQQIQQHQHQQYHGHGSAGGPGSAFESSKRNQSSVQQIRPNMMLQQQQDQSNTPTRNDSRKTSGANTPNKDGADTPTTKAYRDQDEGDSSTSLFSQQQQNASQVQQQHHQPQQHHQQQQQYGRDLDVINPNMFE